MAGIKPIYIVTTPFFPTPERWRGAFCYDFVRAIIRTGRYDVRVFVHWDGRVGDGGDYDYNGIHVYRFRFWLLPCGLEPFLLSRTNRNSFLRKAKDVGIDWSRVAVYHAHEPLFADYVDPIKKTYPQIKTLLHFHSGPLLHLRTGRLGIVPIHATILYQYYKRLHETVDLPVFVSKRQQRLYGGWYRDGYDKPVVDIREGLVCGRFLNKFNMKPSVVLYNGYDSHIFNAETRSHHKGFRIGCVGNFTKEKDQITLLKAIKMLDMPDLKVIFVGSGEQLNNCKTFATKSGLSDKVDFWKEIDHLKLPEFYGSLDLFVLPSWVEGFGCSYMEAYGCGTPFMGCRDVSVEEAIPVEDWDKWLFPMRDYKTLARLIENYRQHKYKQRLSRTFEIDALVGEFISSL